MTAEPPHRDFCQPSAGGGAGEQTYFFKKYLVCFTGIFLGHGLAQATLSGKPTRTTHGTYCSRTGGRIRGHCSCLLIGTNVHEVRHGETLAMEHNLDELAKAALFEIMAKKGIEEEEWRRIIRAWSST